MKQRYANIVSGAALVISLASLGVTYWAGQDRIQSHSFNKLPVAAASLDKPCLPIMADRSGVFEPGEVEKSDFCAPDGSPILSVITSDSGAWDFSEPWQTEGAAASTPDRLGFARRATGLPETTVQVVTVKHTYLLTIESD